MTTETDGTKSMVSKSINFMPVTKITEVSQLSHFSKAQYAREAISFFNIYPEVFLMRVEITLTFIFILCSTQVLTSQQYLIKL